MNSTLAISLIGIAISIIIVIFLFKTIKQSKREQYAKGFKWGKREHSAELNTTRLLLIGLITLGFHLWLGIYWIEYIALFILVLAYIYRLVAAYAHKREKHYMDSLRFKR